MRNLFAKLWADDAGVVTIEYLVLGTFLALALIVGVTTLAAGINEELAELANAVGAFDQGYSASGFSGCGASTAGSATNDTCTPTDIGRTQPEVCSVDAEACN